MSAAPRTDLIERALRCWCDGRSEWLDQHQLAEEMGVSVRTIQRLVKQRKIPRPLVDDPAPGRRGGRGVKRWHRLQFVKMVDRKERM